MGKIFDIVTELDNLAEQSTDKAFKLFWEQFRDEIVDTMTPEQLLNKLYYLQNCPVSIDGKDRSFADFFPEMALEIQKQVLTTVYPGDEEKDMEASKRFHRLMHLSTANNLDRLTDPSSKALRQLYVVMHTAHQIATHNPYQTDILYGQASIDASQPLNCIKAESKEIPKSASGTLIRDLNRDTRLVEAGASSQPIITSGLESEEIRERLIAFCGETEQAASPKSDTLDAHAHQGLAALVLMEIMRRFNFTLSDDNQLMPTLHKHEAALRKSDSGEIQFHLQLDLTVSQCVDAATNEQQFVFLGADQRSLETLSDGQELTDIDPNKPLMSIDSLTDLKFDKTDGKYYLQFTQMNVTLNTPDIKIKQPFTHEVEIIENPNREENEADGLGPGRP